MHFNSRNLERQSPPPCTTLATPQLLPQIVVQNCDLPMGFGEKTRQLNKWTKCNIHVLWQM